MMKSAIRNGLAAGLLLATAASASAQTNWTGISIGAGVGGGSINHDLKLSPGALLPPGVFSAELDSIGGEGFLGTVGIAADLQFGGRYVIGAFLDYDFSKLESNRPLKSSSRRNLILF